MVGSKDSYVPDTDFEVVAKDPLLDISLTDSQELWLIQWPIHELQVSEFNGKEVTLKPHHDGKLGSFENSAGKSYDIVSHAAQDPDATVFLASQSETKIVGKISRRVCLVHYPEPSELEKPGYGGNFSLSCQRSEGSFKKSMSRYSGTPIRRGSIVGSGASQGTLNSGINFGERSIGQESKKKRRENGKVPSVMPTRSAEQSSHASGVGSQLTSASLASESSQGAKSSKKKKIKVEK